MLRLVRQGLVLQIVQPRDRPYIYKCPSSKIRENSAKLDHHLSIVDTFIELEKPDFFEVEPQWESYKPDVYCRIRHQLWCIEVQRSKVTNPRIQRKINEFVRSYQKEEHDALNLWVRSPYSWEKLQAPTNIDIKIAPAWGQGST